MDELAALSFMIQQTASSQLVIVEGSLSTASHGLSARSRVTTPGVSTCVLQSHTDRLSGHAPRLAMLRGRMCLKQGLVAQVMDA